MRLIKVIRPQPGKHGALRRRRYVGRVTATRYAAAARDPYVRGMVERIAAERAVRRTNAH